MKEAPSYIAAVVVLVGTADDSVWKLIRKDPPLEDKKCVMSILMYLLVGIMRFLFGKLTR